MSGHTPGPWRVIAADWDTEKSGELIANESLAPVGPLVRYYVEHNPPEISAANGRLIQAAPDLLAALKATESWEREREEHEDSCPYCTQTDGRGCSWDGWKRGGDVFSARRAAIAKAEGK